MMPQAAMLYARQVCNTTHEGEGSGFNAASGNAIRATEFGYPLGWAYPSFNAASGNAIRATSHDLLLSSNLDSFQCRKRQCYTRDSVSRSPRIYWAQTEIFTTFPFSHRKEAIFRGHRVFKISENIMSALDFQWLIVSTIFCCNLPRFSGQKRKNYEASPITVGKPA